MDALHTYLMWFEYANLEDFMLWNGYGFAAFEKLKEHGITTIDWLAKAAPQEIAENTGLDELTAYEVLFEAIRLSGNPDDPEAIRDGYYKIENYHPVTLKKGAVAGFSIGKNHTPTAEDYVIGVAKSGAVIPAE